MVPAGSNPDAAEKSADPQKAALVLLLDEQTLERADLAWPLTADTYFNILREIGENYNPAAVFVDIMLTHERIDTQTRVPKGERRCLFEPPHKFVEEYFKTLDTRAHPSYRVSHEASFFFCARYLFRPVGQNLPPEALADAHGKTREDPRIPLIFAVPNPDLSTRIARRMIASEGKGGASGALDDFLRLDGHAPDSFEESVTPSHLLMPGLRGVATPAIIEWVPRATQPGVMPLEVSVGDGPGAANDAKTGLQKTTMTTPAAAALVAYCRHHWPSELPGCQHLGTALSDDHGIWTEGRVPGPKEVYVRWGQTPAATYRYLGGSAENTAGDDKEKGRTLAQKCLEQRRELRSESGTSTVPTWLKRLKWSAKTALEKALAEEPNAGEPRNIDVCYYTPVLRLDIRHPPFLQTPQMDTAEKVEDLINGRVVFIGTAFEIYQDALANPVVGAAPGVLSHAMLFDNLLRYGKDVVTPSSDVTIGSYSVNISKIDMYELLLIFLLGSIGIAYTGFARYVEERAWRNKEPTELPKLAAWEPAMGLLALFVGILTLYKTMNEPVAD